MRDRVNTSGAGLLSNPRFWDAPSLGQFFGPQYFEEWSGGCLIVLRLFSTHNLCLYFNDLLCMAVHKTAHLTQRIDFPFSGYPPAPIRAGIGRREGPRCFNRSHPEDPHGGCCGVLNGCGQRE